MKKAKIIFDVVIVTIILLYLFVFPGDAIVEVHGSAFSGLMITLVGLLFLMSYFFEEKSKLFGSLVSMSKFVTRYDTRKSVFPIALILMVGGLAIILNDLKTGT